MIHDEVAIGGILRGALVSRDAEWSCSASRRVIRGSRVIGSRISTVTVARHRYRRTLPFYHSNSEYIAPQRDFSIAARTYRTMLVGGAPDRNQDRSLHLSGSIFRGSPVHCFVVKKSEMRSSVARRA